MTARRTHRPGGVDSDQDTALFRYALIREAADESLTPRERGALVRELAGQEHRDLSGVVVPVSRVSLDRWVRAYRGGGFEALFPAPRAPKLRTAPEVLELAAALKREKPARTAAQVVRILRKHVGDAPSARTVQRHFARLELNTTGAGAPRVFGRFEAAARNDRWTGDALHGPLIAGRKTYLFAFIDDHSRALVAYRWSHAEDTLRLQAALRSGLRARGVPKVVYLDNGSAMISKQLLRALAVTGIRLTHSKPGEPAGRGKIERFFRTVRDQFLVELSTPQALADVGDVAGLNALFTAWVETVYHHQVHSETRQEPLARFLAAGPPDLPDPQLLVEAFWWSHQRLVTKTATINLLGNVYQVDAALVGRKVELVFDPLDMTELTVRYQGRDMGRALPHKITRHVHPDARTDAPAADVPKTGINYLKTVATGHQETLAARINYANLPSNPEPDDGGEDTPANTGGDDPIDAQLPGQLDLTDLADDGEGEQS